MTGVNGGTLLIVLSFILILSLLFIGALKLTVGFICVVLSILLGLALLFAIRLFVFMLFNMQI